ncbi:MAG: PH domain-containing protein [Chloroflexi bacterium]|nr:PH domain-containing protein [Chloroflexota bacterium]
MFGRLLGNTGAVNSDNLQRDYGRLLADDEQVHAGFKVIRDTWIFTDRRLILVDIQGMTRRKKEYLSIPYGKITMYSVETTGTFDLDAELKLWVGSNPQPIEKKFNKSVDVYAVQALLTQLMN